MTDKFKALSDELIHNTEVDGFGILIKDFMTNQLKKESELNALIKQKELEIKALENQSYKKIICIFRKIIPYMRTVINENGNYIASFNEIPLSYDEVTALERFLIESDSIKYK